MSCSAVPSWQNMGQQLIRCLQGVNCWPGVEIRVCFALPALQGGKLTIGHDRALVYVDIGSWGVYQGFGWAWVQLCFQGRVSTHDWQARLGSTQSRFRDGFDSHTQMGAGTA